MGKVGLSVSVVLQASFLTAIVLSVGHHGAVHVPILAIVSIWMALIALYACTRSISAELVGALNWTMLLSGVFVILAVLQSMPLGIAHESWLDAQDFIGGKSGVVSVSPEATISSTLRIVAPTLTFMLSIILFQGDESARLLLFILAIIGLLFAMFGLWEFVFSPDTLLFQARTYQMDGVTGPFVNRNTAATFFGITVILWVSLFMRRFKRIGVSGLKRFVLEMDNSKNKELIKLAFCLSALLIVLVALFLTKSRAGITSSLFATACVLMLNAKSPNNTGPLWIRRISIGAGSAAVLLALLWLYGSAVLTRLSDQSVFDDGRWCFFKSVLRASLDHPWTGLGLGTINFSFPAYRAPSCLSLGLVLDRAHNGYLELFMGLGLPGLFILFIGITVLGCIYAVGIRQRRRFRSDVVSAQAVLILCILNSLFDFSLQITGVAIFAAAVFGAGCVVALSGSSGRKIGSRE
jgi:O-antigen ligase